MSNVVLSSSIRANLLSLQGTSSLMDKTQLTLSTGKKVNSALDNATSFFAAKSLTDRASDLNSLLDAMGQSISGLKQADTGVTNLTKMVDQAKAIAGQAFEALAKGTQEAKVHGRGQPEGHDRPDDHCRNQRWHKPAHLLRPTRTVMH